MAFSPETYALLLKKIEEGGGGGSSLPSVTAADNGKVLSVVNGAWAADARGKVVFEDPEINKSFNDLLAMFNQGIIPWLIDEFEEDGVNEYWFKQCSYLHSEEGLYLAVFASIDRGNLLNGFAFVSSDPTLPMFLD